MALLLGWSCTHADDLGSYRGEIPIEESRVRLIQSGALDEYSAGIEALRKTYRERLANQLEQFADEVILFKLDCETVRVEEDGGDPFHPSSVLKQKDRFPVWPYYGTSGVLAIKRYKETDKGYADVLRTFYVLLEDGLNRSGPFIHYPDYGVRFLHKGEILYETTLSLRTGNCYVYYPDGYVWQGIKQEYDQSITIMLESVFGEKPMTR